MQVSESHRKLYNGSPAQPRLSIPDEDLDREVNFYLYEGPAYDWERNCSLGDNLSKFNTNLSKKHGGEVYFVQQLRNHPWRVHDPDMAELFVVPTLLGVAARLRGCAGIHHHGMLEATALALQNSPHFVSSGGQNHIMLSTDFKADYLKHVNSANETLAHTIWAGLVEKPINSQCYLTVPFAGVLPPENVTSEELLAQTYEEFSQRPIRLFFRGQIDDRAAYKARRTLGRIIVNLSSTASVIYASSSLRSKSTYLRRCPHRWQDCLSEPTSPTGEDSCVACLSSTEGSVFAQELANSQFCFSIEGDNERTSRLHEAIRMGCMPIIIGDHIWAIGQPSDYKVPWWNMTFHIPLKELSVKAIEKILNTPKEELQEKRKILQQFAPDVLWDVPNSRVTSNILFEAYHRCVNPRLSQSGQHINMYIDNSTTDTSAIQTDSDIYPDSTYIVANASILILETHPKDANLWLKLQAGLLISVLLAFATFKLVWGRRCRGRVTA